MPLTHFFIAIVYFRACYFETNDWKQFCDNKQMTSRKEFSSESEARTAYDNFLMSFREHSEAQILYCSFGEITESTIIGDEMLQNFVEPEVLVDISKGYESLSNHIHN